VLDLWLIFFIIIFTICNCNTSVCYFLSDFVSLNVTLQQEGSFIANLSGNCAPNRQLKDYIKPLIWRKFGSELINARRRLGIRMYCSGDRNWSSPAKLFQAGLQQTNSFSKSCLLGLLYCIVLYCVARPQSG